MSYKNKLSFDRNIKGEFFVFFDIKEADKNGKLFKGLYIEKTESFKEQGQYPVIFLSLNARKNSCYPF